MLSDKKKLTRPLPSTRTTLDQAKCLNDLPTVMAQYDYLKDNIAPGEKISALKQCQKAFGPKFRPHLSQDEEPFEVLNLLERL